MLTAGPFSKMVSQQEKTACLFLLRRLTPYMGTMYTVSSSNCPSSHVLPAIRFSCLLQGHFPRWCHNRKRLHAFSCCDALHLTWAQCTLSAAVTVQVLMCYQQFASHVYCRAIFQDGVTTGKDCMPFPAATPYTLHGHNVHCQQQ